MLPTPSTKLSTKAPLHDIARGILQILQQSLRQRIEQNDETMLVEEVGR